MVGAGVFTGRAARVGVVVLAAFVLSGTVQVAKAIAPPPADESVVPVSVRNVDSQSPVISPDGYPPRDRAGAVTAPRTR